MASLSDFEYLVAAGNGNAAWSGIGPATSSRPPEVTPLELWGGRARGTLGAYPRGWRDSRNVRRKLRLPR